ncbi:MAG: tetratricopeptide repeat protein [Planctomycetota bacterium]
MPTSMPASAPASAPESAPAVPSLQRARACFLEGAYEEAIEVYETLGSKAGSAVRAACGRSEIDLQVGDYKAGIERLRLLEKAGRSSADWHASLATLLAETGEYEQAIRHNRRAIEIDSGHYRARRQLGRLLEMLGHYTEALETYAFFEEVTTSGPLPDTPEELTDLGTGFYRASVLRRHSNMVQRTRHVLREVYQEAFDVVDPLYWPGRLAAAELLLEKHNLADARDDFERIIAQNPKVAAARIGLGLTAIAEWEFEEAEKSVETALKINPRSVSARMLLASICMMDRRYEDAAATAREALETNPNSIEALSLLAAAQVRLGDQTGAEATRRRVEKINAKPARLHYELGVWLSAARQYDDAERHYLQAIEFAPFWPEPRTDLGLVYMETGQEKQARQTLEASFALDSFDYRTHGILDLLDELDKFERVETQHFIIKYDEKQDGVIGAYFAEALEKMYSEVCQAYGTEPDAKTMIEVFPNHMGFSMRTAGRPFIGTIGACTGRVIAMSAPRRDASVFGRYNWALVLRHEFTHTVTIAATENWIPRWLTEGLAVSQEHTRRSWSFKKLLSDAVIEDRLFTLDAIDWGFVRPKRSTDCGQAYAQSEWMVEYITERWGPQAIADLLAAFRDLKKQPEAVRQALKIDCETFDRDFKAWATKHATQWGMPHEPEETVEEIERKLEEAPEDAELLARLAIAQLRGGDLEKAEETAREALADHENDKHVLEAFCHVVIVKMLREKDFAVRPVLIDEVEPFLRKLIELDPENPSAIKYLGYVEQSRQRWKEASQWLLRYQRRFPEDPDTYRRMASVHLKQDKTQLALHQLETLFELVEDEPAVAAKIAGLHRNARRHEQAATWYRRAIDIDPYDPDIHAELGGEYLVLGRLLEAEREYKLVCRLTPNKATGFEGLSRVYAAMGNLKESEAYKAKAKRRPRKDPASLGRESSLGP